MRLSWTACALLLVLGGCNSEPDRKIPIGEAYVGPANLRMREDLALRAKVTAVVRHGDKLQVLERRRRFVLVRTEQGAEGWLDSRILLSPAQMAELRRTARRNAQLPSQGKATPFNLLNVHTEPNRQAPTFYQIKEGELVDVIGRRLVERAPYQPAPLLFEETDQRSRSRKPVIPTHDDYFPPPAAPEPPGPPENWLELSRSGIRARTLESRVPAASESASRKVDNWYLVRLANGNAGWALAAMLRMAIPDEVAQNAQGHRITSCFPVGWLKSKEQTHYHWLWTTSSSGLHAHDFDSLRVFVYSPQRRRYETAYIERNLEGFYPVHADPLPRDLSAQSGPETPLHFSLLVRQKDGRLWRRTYQFHNRRARLLSREVVSDPAATPAGRDHARAGQVDPRRDLSAFEQVKRKVGEWKRGIVGR